MIRNAIVDQINENDLADFINSPAFRIISEKDAGPAMKIFEVEDALDGVRTLILSTPIGSYMVQ